MICFIRSLVVGRFPSAVFGISTYLIMCSFAMALNAQAFLLSDASTAKEQEAALITAAMELKIGAMSKVGADLAKLHRQHQTFILQKSLRTKRGTLVPSNPMLKIVDNKVVIDAVAAENSETLLRDLEALGLVNGARYGFTVSGHLPLESIQALAKLKSLQFARPAMAMTRVGLVTSQGDVATNADEARDEEEVRGRGATVGVLSDSYDCLGGAATDIASRDLPRASRITVLDDSACPGSDEGRAMMQLVRDLAPAARQAFHTAFGGEADFANGILELANVAGADIIVDDVIYFGEPMFQDGIIAQAVETVKAQGVAYFSSAGNGGRNSWESSGFISSGVSGAFGGLRHDFDPGAGIDDLQSVLLGTGTTIFAFQWDEPYASVNGAPGSASDVDIVLYLPGGIFIGSGGFNFNIGGDPVEVFVVVNSGPPAVLEIGIELLAGPAPGFMKYVIFDPGVDTIGDPATSFVIDFPTDSSTNYGHSNAAGAAAVGAAFWRQTPSFGVSPAEIENFSSAGGTPILFDTDGNRIAPDIRQKPNFTGPDGGITTFFGGRNEFGNTAPQGNHYFGTSASAPHVAAVAALMLEANQSLTPDAIYEILEDTAIDMDDPSTPGFDQGFDYMTGFGFVDAEEAVEEAEDY